MSEKRYFMGVDFGDKESVGIVAEVEGYEIGILQEFNIARTREVHPIHKFKEGIYRITERQRHVLSMSKLAFSEEGLRRLILDEEHNIAPPRKSRPVPKKDWMQ